MVEICTGAYPMIDTAIIISNLNDFVFCPASIYFHNLYGTQNTMTYQAVPQLRGTAAHENVDNNKYSTRKDILTGLAIYSEQYNIVGKIDIYDARSKTLIERKRYIKKIYDGYIFQLYAQYFGMMEMGYTVEHLRFHSMTDNRNYDISLPYRNDEMFHKFQSVIYDIQHFEMDTFIQTNGDKCRNCIYEPACDRGKYD